MHANLLLLALFLFGPIVSAQQKKMDRPNIVFCLADDWGWPHAGAYGDSAVLTPAFDRLAEKGILFHQAYVSSPSCTPSRNAFITGKYHWELGSGANLWSTLPLNHQSFIHILMDNGYEAGHGKEKTWGPGDISPWLNHHGAHPGGPEFESFSEFLDQRDIEKPFFYWQGTSDPHRGYVEGSGKANDIDISKVHMFDHYPDDEIVRSDIADYYLEVQRWDTLVGNILSQLEAQNLLNNTIVIMTGDHGMPFPRCKGNLYDSGVRVPFALHWADGVAKPAVVEDYISFADIAPTLLQLAGLEIPVEMSGSSFAYLINSAYEKDERDIRDHVVFGKERHVPAQERPDMGGYPSRGYRNDDFLYIVNFEPERWPAGSGKIGSTNYPDQWYADCDGGPTKDYIVENKEKDIEHARAYELCFAKRPREELYDLKKDPGQVVNVAYDPTYKEKKEEMRHLLMDKLKSLNDPRAEEPNYSGFDVYPYLGGGGGKRKIKR